MGTFRIISTVSNTPAEVGDYSIYLANRVDKILTPQMFTSFTVPEYSNSDNSAATHIKILTLPGTPEVLKFNGVPVILDQEISIADIGAGLLVYDAPDQDNLANNSFQFTVKTATLDYPVDTGTFLITSAKLSVQVNNPPVVGDLSLNLVHGTTHNFTLANFTTETSPGYYDPEADAASVIKITSLPIIGQLLLNGVAVTLNQEIAVADIGGLIYQPDNNITAQSTISFKFRIQDAGSGMFSVMEGLITIAVAELVKNPPTVSNNLAILNSVVYDFKLADVTLNFNDPNGDSYKNLKITTLPVTGSVRNLGVDVAPGFNMLLMNISSLDYFLASNYTIDNGKLYYYTKALSLIVQDFEQVGYFLKSHQNGSMLFENSKGEQQTVVGTLDTRELKVGFKVSDDSVDELYSDEAFFTLIPQGNANLQPAYVNKPPTIGDINLDVDMNVTTVITMDTIKNLSDPRYSDPENDPIGYVRIDSIDPNNIGVFYFNNSPVYAGLIMTAADINQNLFKHVGTNNSGIITDSLGFSVKDTGSGKWSN